MRGPFLTFVAASALAIPTLARAEEAAETPPVSVAFNASIVSDYRDRGLSLSDRDPAVQVGADLSSSAGFFLGTWASNIADYGGSNVEIDLYGGYGGSLAGFNYLVGAYGFVYPGGHNVAYYELQTKLSRTIGPVTTALTVGFSPNQANIDENLYLGLDGAVAISGTPVTVKASVGRENGAYDHKYDWSAGLTYTLDAFDISATYVDSNYEGALEAGRNGRAGVVLSVRANF